MSKLCLRFDQNAAHLVRSKKVSDQDSTKKNFCSHTRLGKHKQLMYMAPFSAFMILKASFFRCLAMKYSFGIRNRFKYFFLAKIVH